MAYGCGAITVIAMCGICLTLGGKVLNLGGVLGWCVSWDNGTVGVGNQLSGGNSGRGEESLKSKQRFTST